MFFVDASILSTALGGDPYKDPPTKVFTRINFDAHSALPLGDKVNNNKHSFVYTDHIVFVFLSVPIIDLIYQQYRMYMSLLPYCASTEFIIVSPRNIGKDFAYIGGSFIFCLY